MVTLLLSEEAGVQGERTVCGYRVQGEHGASQGEMKGELTKCSSLLFILHFSLLKDKTRTKRSETLIILLKEVNGKHLLIN